MLCFLLVRRRKKKKRVRERVRNGWGGFFSQGWKAGHALLVEFSWLFGAING
jgi:hypothetical protein